MLFSSKRAKKSLFALTISLGPWAHGWDPNGQDFEQVQDHEQDQEQYHEHIDRFLGHDHDRDHDRDYDQDDYYHDHDQKRSGKL